MTVEHAVQTAPETEARGLDGWLRRYSRWKERRLTTMAELPLSALALQNLYLCGCILLDGVLIPWIVVLLGGGFSYALFAALLLPAVVVEAVLYRRIKARTPTPPENASP